MRSSPPQSAIHSWSLGTSKDEFAAPAIYDPASRRFFVALHRAGTAIGSALVSWPVDAAGGHIAKVSDTLALPSLVERLVPAAATHATDEMEVEEEIEDRLVTYAIFKDGGIAACSTSRVLAECEDLKGRHVASATAAAGGMLRIVAAGGGAAACCALLSLRSGRLQCESLVELAPPEFAGAVYLLSATWSAKGRAALLWSDGSLAFYGMGTRGGRTVGETSPQAPSLTRKLHGFRLPVDAAAPPTVAKSGRKRPLKQAAAASSENCGRPALIDLGVGLLAVVGWSSGAEPEALRVVSIDSQYGCVQVAVDLPRGEIGMGSADINLPVEVRHDVLVFSFHVFSCRVYVFMSTTRGP
jgi:hypothetical protein